MNFVFSFDTVLSLHFLLLRYCEVSDSHCLESSKVYVRYIFANQEDQEVRHVVLKFLVGKFHHFFLSFTKKQLFVWVILSLVLLKVFFVGIWSLFAFHPIMLSCLSYSSTPNSSMDVPHPSVENQLNTLLHQLNKYLMTNWFSVTIQRRKMLLFFVSETNPPTFSHWLWGPRSLTLVAKGGLHEKINFLMSRCLRIPKQAS